jgi:hypothetical protein
MKTPGMKEFWEVVGDPKLKVADVRAWLKARKMSKFYDFWNNDHSLRTHPTYEEYVIWFRPFTKLGKYLNEGKDE